MAYQLRRVPLTAPPLVAVGRHVCKSELRRLHDVLETTPIAGRYWMFGGVLLGWARERNLLSHDTTDVDFAFQAADWNAMLAAIAPLAAAGFRLGRVYRNNDGVLTQVVFQRSGIDFDFLSMWPTDDRLRYFGYFEGVEIVAEIPAQPLAPFEFLGRRWLKAEDHDKDLTALYGDWRTPQRDWRTDRDSPAVMSRRPWSPSQSDPKDLSLEL